MTTLSIDPFGTKASAISAADSGLLTEIRSLSLFGGNTVRQSKQFGRVDLSLLNSTCLFCFGGFRLRFWGSGGVTVWFLAARHVCVA